MGKDPFRARKIGYGATTGRGKDKSGTRKRWEVRVRTVRGQLRQSRLQQR